MGKSNKSTGRGLDHLIEQNSTELDFLSAYVGPEQVDSCLLYTSPSPRDGLLSRMPSSA